MKELSPVTMDSRSMACQSYAFLLLGLPLFLFPLLMRKDAFAIHHAKQAAEICIGSVLLFGLVFLSPFFTGDLIELCFPTLVLPCIPVVHGMLLAVSGQWRSPVGVTGLVDSALARVQADRK